MSHLTDPQRYRMPGSGASDAARALLDLSRTEVPTADQLAKLAERLPLLGAASLGGGHAPSASGSAGAGAPALGAPAAAASLLPSILIGASLAVAVVCAGWWNDATREAAPYAPRPVATVAPVAAPLGARGPAIPAPTAIPTVDPPPLAAAPAPLSPPATATRAGGAVGEADVPAPSAGALTNDDSAALGDVETESQLLQRAQQTLPRDPAAALAIADEHRRRFHGGVLAQERDLIAISALVALGRTAEARDGATRFLTSYPRSAHRPGIEALVPGLNVGEPSKKGEQSSGTAR